MIVVGLVAALGLPAWLVSEKERALTESQTLLLELAPVDPRSLMQGDYMRLDYAIARGHAIDGWPTDGALVVRGDASGVAQFVRVAGAESLAYGEHKLAYRVRGGRLQVGTDAFYFQEGRANEYAAAKYGEIRVAPDGTAILVGLRDKDRKPLGR